MSGPAAWVEEGQAVLKLIRYLLDCTQFWLQVHRRRKSLLQAPGTSLDQSIQSMQADYQKTKTTDGRIRRCKYQTATKRRNMGPLQACKGWAISSQAQTRVSSSLSTLWLALSSRGLSSNISYGGIECNSLQAHSAYYRAWKRLACIIPYTRLIADFWGEALS